MYKKRNTLLLAFFILFALSTVCGVIIAAENQGDQNGQEAEDEGANDDDQNDQKTEDNGVNGAFSAYIQLRLNYVVHDGDYQKLNGDFTDAKDDQGANLEEVRDGIINYLDTFSASSVSEGVIDSISNTINLSLDAWEALSDREKVKRISDALHDIRTDVLTPLGDRVQTARQDWLDAGGEEVVPPAIFLCAGGGTCKVRYPKETDTDTHHITCPYEPCVTDGYQYWECQVSGRVCPRSEEHTHIPSKSESSLSGICPECKKPHSTSGSGS